MFSELSVLPPELARALKDAGLWHDMTEFSQLILVTAKASSAEILCYIKDTGGIWRLDEQIGVMSGHIGRNGVSRQKMEGDGCTPAGCFRLGYAFGLREKPDTLVPYKNITRESFWVDDPSSRFYNTWVEGSINADWSSAEHLCDYPREYAYGVVIGYNTGPVMPRKGSAVFFHCGNKPTAGCVAVPEEDLLRILKWLDPAKNPSILITDTRL